MQAIFPFPRSRESTPKPCADSPPQIASLPGSSGQSSVDITTSLATSAQPSTGTLEHNRGGAPQGPTKGEQPRGRVSIRDRSLNATRTRNPGDWSDIFSVATQLSLAVQHASRRLRSGRFTVFNFLAMLWL
ncbi:hypothetical protein OBBRIDRAFT_423643 [Obba rivulosa]|uniref:Uncharacterized protein n=1 Tax=Obba rivulosa TaxID=1052685 RepID=A0A8E2DP21_9APHY|nr:hypothetical protein OBBRIDRAFT_423643 [Obba rivulosa]